MSIALKIAARRQAKAESWAEPPVDPRLEKLAEQVDLTVERYWAWAESVDYGWDLI